MSVCKSLKGYSRKHERLADLFSLLAVALFFGTLYIVLSYYTPIIGWLKTDAVIHVPIAIAVLLFDIFLMYMCLDIGASRFSGEDERCFHTFKGRRSGSGSIGTMFNSWLHHMEHVGKKHR
ncbi:MAG: cell division protein BolA [Candidatus Thiodiazotropha sp.]|nr:cell division protein BolA [Candidatus Thiodiazotropha sp.]MCM8882710.1 cell division protein BolA [Candidatus Thiodiazotropha sp.]MCM8920783.1 cell division protein BolA [Candidatus Thiodiazotropha sp.]MCU7804112.1 cell division protein BolA [Candidatus Thiodiazotropha sp. (ex Lucinoma borealis)]MCU7876354.1 cell division protein BolA [Candidatus Thiodiazotropha sp. (ex Lucinoma borealis)]